MKKFVSCIVMFLILGISITLANSDRYTTQVAAAPLTSNVSSEPHQCDMDAVIMKSGYEVTDIADTGSTPTDPDGPWNDPKDFYYYFTKLRSGPNPDGYGIVYYKNGEQSLNWSTQKWTTPYQYSINPTPLENAKSAITNSSNNAVIVMAHARYGQAGHAGNHPFVTNWNGRTFAMEENGWHQVAFKESMYHYLYYHGAGSNQSAGQWFVDHPPCDGGTASDIDTFNGTELNVNRIVHKIIGNGGDIFRGIFEAYTSTSENPSGGVFDYYDLWKNHNGSGDNGCNMVFSDGDSLWAYRSTSDPQLSYKDFGNWIGLKTQGTIAGGTQIPVYSLMQFKRDGTIVEYPNFLDCKTRVDDTSMTKYGTWATYTNANCFDGSEQFSSTANDYCEYTFNGPEVYLYGTKGSNYGKMDVYINGTLDASDVDSYNSTGMIFQQLLYHRTGLPTNQTNTIRLVVKGTHSAGNGNYIDIDKFVTAPQTTSDVTEDDTGASFIGSWSPWYDGRCYDGSEQYSNTTNDYCQYSFNGTAIKVYGSKNTTRGKMDVYINGTLDTSNVDNYNAGGMIYNQLLFTKTGLPSNQTNTIKLVINGTKNPSATDHYLDIDEFVYTP